MKTELGTLAIALQVKTDDPLKASPYLAPWRPAVGIAPQLTDAELVTLAMTQAVLGFTSRARWLRHARSHLRPFTRERQQGLPVAFALTGAKADEREPLLDLLSAEPGLVAARPAQTLIGDKNYFGRGFEDELAEQNIRLLRPARRGEPERPGAPVSKPLRQVIESVNEASRANSSR